MLCYVNTVKLEEALEPLVDQFSNVMTDIRPVRNISSMQDSKRMNIKDAERCIENYSVRVSTVKLNNRSTKLHSLKTGTTSTT